MSNSVGGCCFCWLVIDLVIGDEQRSTCTSMKKMGITCPVKSIAVPYSNQGKGNQEIQEDVTFANTKFCDFQNPVHKKTYQYNESKRRSSSRSKRGKPST